MAIHPFPVFLHWRRQREDLGYLAGDREVDLVVNREHPEQLINVAYSVSRAQTWEREIAALEEGAARFPRATRLLVAHEHTTRKPPAGIQVIDAWRYLSATEELSINWTVRKKPSQGLGRRWGEVREFTSRTRGGSRPAPESLSRRVHLWTRLEPPGSEPHRRK